MCSLCGFSEACSRASSTEADLPARLRAAGRALLFLAPSEREPMLAQLEAAGVPVKPIRQNPAKVQHVGPALQALCSKNAELKVRPESLVRGHCSELTCKLVITGRVACAETLHHSHEISPMTSSVYCSCNHTIAVETLRCAHEVMPRKWVCQGLHACFTNCGAVSRAGITFLALAAHYVSGALTIVYRLSGLQVFPCLPLSSADCFAIISADGKTSPQELAQRAVVSYLRSLFLQPNRAVFDVAKLPVRVNQRLGAHFRTCAIFSMHPVPCNQAYSAESWKLVLCH